MSPPLATMSAKEEAGPERQEVAESKAGTPSTQAATSSQQQLLSVVAVTANLRSAGPVRLPNETIVSRKVASAGEKGQGWPYAPQDWPNPGDVWTWRVGHRALNNDHWQDRYLIPPRSFWKEKERSLEFASKKSLRDYLTKHYAEVNTDDFFESFQWRVPSKSPGLAGKRGGDPVRRERLFGVDSNAGKKPKKRCKADNAFCPLELSQSTGAAPSGFSICEICCAEPDFCRECKCILCCGVIEAHDREMNMVRCLQRSSGGGACAHAAHLDCALEAEMAGAVKKSGIDMEYLCRRCDKRSDLRELVTRLLDSLGNTESKSLAQQILRRVLRVLQGTTHGTSFGGNGGRVLEKLVQTTLEQIQEGVEVQQALKSLAAQVVRHQSSGGNVSLPAEGMHQSEASLDQWLPASNTPASLRTTTTPSSLTSPGEKDSPPAVSSGLSGRFEGLRRAVDGSNAATSGGGGLSAANDLRTAMQVQACRADSNAVAGIQRDFSVDGESFNNPVLVERSLSEGKLCTQNSVSSRLTPAIQKHPMRGTYVAGSGLSFATYLHPSFNLGGLPVSHTPLQLLESKLDRQIHDALQQLRETQAAEFKCAEAQLLERKCHLTKAAQSLDQERRNRDVESLVDDDAVRAELYKLQEAEEEFSVMLKVSHGFSSIPGDLLRKLFGWPAVDQHR